MIHRTAASALREQGGLMLSLSRILVPTDLSPHGLTILKEAHYFATTFSASIDVLHVWSPPALVAPESILTGVGAGEQPLLQWISSQAEQQLEQFAARAHAA